MIEKCKAEKRNKNKHLEDTYIVGGYINKSKIILYILEMIGLCSNNAFTNNIRQQKFEIEIYDTIVAIHKHSI